MAGHGGADVRLAMALRGCSSNKVTSLSHHFYARFISFSSTVKHCRRYTCALSLFLRVMETSIEAGG